MIIFIKRPHLANLFLTNSVLPLFVNKPIEKVIARSGTSKEAEMGASYFIKVPIEQRELSL